MTFVFFREFAFVYYPGMSFLFISVIKGIAIFHPILFLFFLAIMLHKLSKAQQTPITFI